MKRKLRGLLSVLISGVLLLGLCLSVSADNAGTISIDKKHFPDSEFRRLVKDKFDKNHDGKLSVKERSAVKDFDTYDTSGKNGDGGDGPYTYGIKNPQGIGYFTELKDVCFKYSSVKSIDLTKNTKLRNVTFFDSTELKKAVMLKGQTLTYSFMQDEAIEAFGKALYCKSRNSKVAKVSRAEKNSKMTLVTAKKAGKTTIKYTGGGSCAITVKTGTKTTSSLTSLTDKQVLTAITNYLKYEQGHDGDSCGGAPCYWDINKDLSNKTTAVVHFRAHTGAHLYYYIDRASGDTYETIKDFLEDTENRTGEKFNVRDYLKYKKH